MFLEGRQFPTLGGVLQRILPTRVGPESNRFAKTRETLSSDGPSEVQKMRQGFMKAFVPNRKDA